MESEIRLQAHGLTVNPSQKFGAPVIFVGSGDSFAAALAVNYLAGLDVACCYPVNFVQNPAVALGRTVCIVSISGRTRANIDVAKVARKRGLRTVAVTANTTSLLAKACDKVVPIKYDCAGVTTSGTISFSATLLTLLSLVSDARIPKDIDRILLRAKEQALGLVDSLEGARSFLFLANGILYPIALYGSLKINEVLGVNAFSYPTEEFCHSPIFGARQSDGIIILSNAGDKSAQLTKRLKQEGFNAIHIRIPQTGIEAILQATFLVQWIALRTARKRGLKQCKFLTDKVALKISSDFIY